MDIDNVYDIFFLQKDFKKKNGFDSYSKNGTDIILHYNLKYNEMSDCMKCQYKLTENDWNLLCLEVLSKAALPPFEMYILAFLFAFKKEYRKSIVVFHKCRDLLPNTMAGNINLVFINLQIAQLLERLEEYRQSLQILISTRRLIWNNNDLFSQVHNFYASCCVSIGLLCFRYFNRPELATANFINSVLIRIRHQSTYSSEVFNHYLSHAYRYIGMMPNCNHQKAYIFMNTAYTMRLELYKLFPDDVTKEDTFHLETDFIVFLIRNRYKVSLINKHSKSLLFLIVELSPYLRKKLLNRIRNIASVLYKYYNIYQFKKKSILWKKMMSLH